MTDKDAIIEEQQKEIENLLFQLQMADIEIEKLENKLFALEDHSLSRTNQWNMTQTDNLSVHYTYNAILETIKKHEQTVSLMDLRIEALTSQIHSKTLYIKKIIIHKQEQEQMFKKDYAIAQIFQKRKDDKQLGNLDSSKRNPRFSINPKESLASVSQLVKGLSIRRTNTSADMDVLLKALNQPNAI
jgi:hypothetical protein